MVGFGKSEHLTKYHQNALNDELLDVILYYVEDICDDRLKEMTLQAQLYGFITSLAVSIFIITVLVIFPIWYSRISKAKTEESAAKYTQIPKNVKTNNSFNLSDSIDEYKNNGIEGKHQLGSPNYTSSNTKGFCNWIYYLKLLYFTKWESLKSPKEKAVFWDISEEDDYSSYESIFELYAEATFAGNKHEESYKYALQKKQNCQDDQETQEEQKVSYNCSKGSNEVSCSADTISDLKRIAYLDCNIVHKSH